MLHQAFWNHFQPGADEHFIAHSLRKSQDQVFLVFLLPAESV